MSFNTDPTKPVQEEIFGRKLKKVSHLLKTLHNNLLSLFTAQRHLELVVDSKLTCNEHIKNILFKTNKSIGLLPIF